MEQWYRKNKVFIPWAFLGLQLATSVVWRIYKSRSGAGKDDEIVPSPLETLLPKISDAEAASLAYPPNAYPGARDVKSPYGSLRVYEFGPEDGRKVLLVHGMSTPCIALGAIAHGLADKRCRVMLFDLPGRGYSSTPVSTPQSTRLFTTCILLSLTSSSLPWTGSGTRFSLIGYSLGGGIVANFTSYFPSLVSSLILLAPSGLVRPERTSLTNKLLYSSGLINETFLEWIIRRRMSHGETPGKRRAAKVVGVAAPATEEAPDDIPGSRLGLPELSRARPGITIPELVVSCSSLLISISLNSSRRHGSLAIIPVSSKLSYLAIVMARSCTRVLTGDALASD